MFKLFILLIIVGISAKINNLVSVSFDFENHLFGLKINKTGIILTVLGEKTGIKEYFVDNYVELLTTDNSLEVRHEIRKHTHPSSVFPTIMTGISIIFAVLMLAYCIYSCATCFNERVKT